MAKRRFELVEGSASNFWEIEVVSETISVRYGRLGSAGQEKSKDFEDDDVAAVESARMIKEKLAKGYREALLSGAAAPKPVSATRYTLKHRQSPVPLVLVLAGNRLVTNDIAQTFDSEREAKEHLDRVIALRKKDGFVLDRTEDVAPDAVEDTPDAEDELEITAGEGRLAFTFGGEGEVLPTTCVKVVRRIEREAPRFVQLLCDLGIPGDEWADAIRGRRIESVRAFAFDTHFQTQTRQQANTIGDLSATLNAFPRLERMFATGDLTTTPFMHETVRALHLLGDPLDPELLRALAASTFPALERLVVSLAADAGPGDNMSAGELIRGLRSKNRAPKLRELHLDSLEDVSEILALVAEQVGSLRVLVLSGDVIEETLLDVIGSQKAKLAQLEVLGLPLSDVISPDVEAQLRKLLPSVKDSDEYGELQLPGTYKEW